jgi:replicative DNA helicase Mcm
VTREAIINYFLTLRTTGDTGTIATTARQNNDLYRLTKAIAKLRLSDTCSKEDAEKAIQIHKASLEALRDPKTGKIDIDIMLGFGKSQRDRLRQIRDIIQGLQGNNGSSAHFNEIIAKAAEKGFSREDTEADIRHLKSAGELIELSDCRYRVT